MSNSALFVEGNEKQFARRMLQSIRCHLGSFFHSPLQFGALLLNPLYPFPLPETQMCDEGHSGVVS